MKQEGYVKNWCENGIRTIEFYHPQGNSLPGLLLRQLTLAFTEAGADESTKVVLLSAGGDGAFCAGGFFDELAALNTAVEGQAFFSGFAHLINAMRKCPKLIIGRIHGKCAGGGVGVAAACDYAIATGSAAVKLSELSIGLGPFVIGPVVEFRIGKAAFAQLAIDATNWRSSDWALNKGLYASVHPDAVGMDESIAALSSQLQRYGSTAMAAVKEMLWQGCEHWNELLPQRAAISGHLVLSPETKEAIRLFKAGSR